MSDWTPSAWRHRDVIVVDNSSGKQALSHYQVKVVLNAASFDFAKAQADGRDLRFTDSDGRTLLDYWIESYDAPGKQAVLWVKVPDIAAGKKMIHLHYGNPKATAASNGARTFEFFDDCDTGAASGKWAVAMGAPKFEYVRHADVFGKPGGIWHCSRAANRRYPGNETVYGGGHATYCAWTRPMAVYAPSQDKTFFAFGHAENSPTVSFYEHKTKQFGPAVVVGLNPDMDAHKNPHVLIDDAGYLYIFYRSHCSPTHLAKSRRPYDIMDWTPMGVVVERSSYPQPWQLKRGEITVLYRGGGTHDATESLVRSTDGGATWSKPFHIVTPTPKNGCYAVTIAETSRYPRKVHIAWSLTRGDWWQRYHVFYAYSDDGGETWRRADGTPYELPITEPTSEMVFESDVPDRGVWLKDIQLDSQGNPYILFIDANSLTYESKWRLAKRSAGKWVIRDIAASDHMYDDGAMVVLSDNDFRVFWNYGDASFPPTTSDVDLFWYGEGLDGPRKMDLRYDPAHLPPGRILMITQPESIDSALKAKGVALANVAIEAKARTGLPQRQHPMLCVRMDDAPRFYGAGVPYGKGKTYIFQGKWSPLVQGVSPKDASEWQDWSFRAFEGQLQLVVNGQTLVEARDATLAAGGIGARVFRTTLYLDDIRVRQFSLPEPTATLSRRK